VHLRWAGLPGDRFLGVGPESGGDPGCTRRHEGILATRLEKGQPISTADVASAARQGDAAAIRAFERGAFFLGAALASYLQLFSPQLIVLSGG